MTNSNWLVNLWTTCGQWFLIVNTCLSSHGQASSSFTLSTWIMSQFFQKALKLRTFSKLNAQISLLLVELNFYSTVDVARRCTRRTSTVSSTALFGQTPFQASPFDFDKLAIGPLPYLGWRLPSQTPAIVLVSTKRHLFLAKAEEKSENGTQGESDILSLIVEYKFIM